VVSGASVSIPLGSNGISIKAIAVKANMKNSGILTAGPYTVIAPAAPTTYTVTFYRNYPTDTSDQTYGTAITVNEGDTMQGKMPITTPAAPSGYDWSMWTTTKGGTTEFDPSVGIMGNTSVWGKWTPETQKTTHNVTFYRNYPTDTSDQIHGEAVPVTEGQTMQGKMLSAPTAPSGYDWSMWTTTKGGTIEFDPSVAITGATSVWGKWTEIPPQPTEHTVTFKMNDGTNNDWITRTTIAGYINPLPTEPSRTTHDFVN
jgi:hypothetical protein